MDYFKDENGKLFAIPADGSGDHLKKPDWVGVTQVEAEAHAKSQLPPSVVREGALLAVSIDVGQGRVIPCPPSKEPELRRVLRRLERTGKPTAKVLDENHRPVTVTVAELRSVLEYMDNEIERIDDEYYAAIEN